MYQLSRLYETDIKDVVRHLTHQPDPQLHLWAGVLIFVVAMIALRRSPAAVAPLGAVILIEAVNEGFDRIYYGSWRWPDTSDDIIRTIGIPLALFLGARIIRTVARAGRPVPPV